MYEIPIEIKNNKVVILSKNIFITEGSSNTIKCIFKLPEEYQDLTNVAVFITDDDMCYKRLIFNNEVNIPLSALIRNTRIAIGVYSYRKNEDEQKIKLIYSPRPAGLNIEKGSYKEFSEDEIIFSQSDFDLWLEKANDMYLKISEINNGIETKIESEIDDSLKEHFKKLNFKIRNGKLFLRLGD